MMVVDTSVFVAAMGLEADADVLVAALGRSSQNVMSAGNYVEAGIIAASRFGGRSDLDEWLREQRVRVVAVDLTLAQLATDAFARYGRGRHRAGLNYGDCFAYALARSLRAPLLFKGSDFVLTDILPALTA